MKAMKLCLSCLLLLVGIFASAQNRQAFEIETIQQLHDFFSYAPSRTPLIFAHRGGAAEGLPENCIATFEHRPIWDSMEEL